MDNSRNNLVPHPHYLEILFAFKSKVSSVFRDVLGIHEINHISLTRINKNNELLTLSSTPAMEFNLFSSPLWRHDLSYSFKWVHLCTQSYWQALYDRERYDELYYLKQIKHSFPIGLSIAAKIDDDFVIYSLASHKSGHQIQELFSNHQEDFYKIGQYCTSRLNPLFNQYDLSALNLLQKQVEYETSK
jgi:hypothetical protein